MAKIISINQATEMVKEGSSLMIGGFLAVGCPDNLVDALVSANTQDLTMIVICSDYIDRGVGKLVANNQIKKILVSHIGTNKATQEQMNNGKLEVTLIPQGTLMEQIRASGAGLGGILTPTGIGTVVAEGKQIIEIDGKEFILEKAIPADFALVRAYKADKHGNLVYQKTARNSNPIMASAGKITIAEVDEIVEIGELNADEIVTPGVFVDYIIQHKD